MSPIAHCPASGGERADRPLKRGEGNDTLEVPALPPKSWFPPRSQSVQPGAVAPSIELRDLQNQPVTSAISAPYGQERSRASLAADDREQSELSEPGSATQCDYAGIAERAVRQDHGVKPA